MAAWAEAAELRGRMGVKYGEPIAAETLTAMKADEAMELLRQRVDELRRDVGEKLRRF